MGSDSCPMFRPHPCVGGPHTQWVQSVVSGPTSGPTLSRHVTFAGCSLPMAMCYISHLGPVMWFFLGPFFLLNFAFEPFAMHFMSTSSGRVPAFRDSLFGGVRFLDLPSSHRPSAHTPRGSTKLLRSRVFLRSSHEALGQVETWGDIILGSERCEPCEPSNYHTAFARQPIVPGWRITPHFIP